MNATVIARRRPAVMLAPAPWIVRALWKCIPLPGLRPGPVPASSHGFASKIAPSCDRGRSCRSRRVWCREVVRRPFCTVASSRAVPGSWRHALEANGRHAEVLVDCVEERPVLDEGLDRDRRAPRARPRAGDSRRWISPRSDLMAALTRRKSDALIEDTRLPAALSAGGLTRSSAMAVSTALRRLPSSATLSSSSTTRNPLSR